MSQRTETLQRLAFQIGPILEIEELGNGWPALASLIVGGEQIHLALFVSTVGLSGRDRDSVERRFQNPAGATPLEGVVGRVSILLGVWESDDYVRVSQMVIAIADAERRDGRSTRWSVFLSVDALKEALTIGWSGTTSASGERIYYTLPALLPIAIAAISAGAEPNENAIYRALSGLGIDAVRADPKPTVETERVRRTVSSLVRDSRFSGAVLNAYARQCAMCGLGLGLVQGAHIYPASAPGSNDHPTNGLALCANHHLAFDRHLIAVLPDNFEIVFHPSAVEAASTDEAVRLFINSTLAQVRPTVLGDAPDRNALLARYDYYEADYVWIGLPRR